MRIGTWNLDNEWSSARADLLIDQDCDVWLLTEVRNNVVLPGYVAHVTAGTMARGQRWAGVFSRSPLTPQLDPHAASARAVVDGLTFCSTILPWRSCGSITWGGGNHAERTARAIGSLVGVLPRSDLVWGGDWNHSLVGPEKAGSMAGRAHLAGALDHLGLQVPTHDLPHRLGGIGTIDHIAVSREVVVVGAGRVSGVGPEGALSDHDAYVVEIE